MLLFVCFFPGRLVVAGEDGAKFFRASAADFHVAFAVVLDEGLLDAGFDAPQAADVFVRDVGHRESRCAGAAGASDAVDVVVDVAGDVVVEDVGDALDVNAAGGNVGGDEVGEAAFGKLAQDTIAGALRQVAVEFFDGDTGAGQFVGELRGAFFRVAENDRQVRVEFLQLLLQEFELVFFAQHVDALLDGVEDDVAAGIGREGHGAMHGGASEVAHVLRQGCGEEQQLPAFRRRAEDLADFGEEAEGEHLVRFVEDDLADGGERYGAAAMMVEDAARRADEKVRAAFQFRQLVLQGGTAGDVYRVDTDRFRQRAGDGMDLAGQFPSRSQDEDLLLCFVAAHLLQERQQEGECFARAGAALGEDVSTFEDVRDRLDLDCGRYADAATFQRCGKRWGHSQTGKCSHISLLIHGNGTICIRLNYITRAVAEQRRSRGKRQKQAISLEGGVILI